MTNDINSAVFLSWLVLCLLLFNWTYPRSRKPGRLKLGFSDLMWLKLFRFSFKPRTKLAHLLLTRWNHLTYKTEVGETETAYPQESTYPLPEHSTTWNFSIVHCCQFLHLMRTRDDAAQEREGEERQECAVWHCASGPGNGSLLGNRCNRYQISAVLLSWTRTRPCFGLVLVWIK